jgi:tetratricopeptide (TPR) repeat protein
VDFVQSIAYSISAFEGAWPRGGDEMNSRFAIFTTFLVLTPVAFGRQTPTSDGLQPPPPPVATLLTSADAVRFRKLAYLPGTNTAWMFGEVKPVTLYKRPADGTARIAELEKGLKGDTSDAERYMELAELYSGLYPNERRDEALAKALPILKKRIGIEPNNAWLHALYSHANYRNATESVAAAQEAVRLAPDDWRCWFVLSNAYGRQLYSNLFGSDEGVPWSKLFDPLAQLNELLGTLSPSAEQISKGEKSLDLSIECIAKAIAVAPKEPDVYRARWYIEEYSDTWRRGFSYWKGIKSVDHGKQYLLSHHLDDSKALASLCPDDPDALGNYAGAILTVAAIQNSAKMESLQAQDYVKISEGFRVLLTSSDVEIFQTIIVQLRLLADRREPEIVEPACRILAGLLVITGDRKEAEQRARRALAIKPAVQQTWDVLINCKRDSVETDSDYWRESYPIFQQQLKEIPSPRNYLLLAIASDTLDKLDEAEAVLRASLKQFPEDVRCRVALAAVLLKQTDKPLAVDEAKEIHQHLQDDIQKMGDQKLYLSFVFNDAILAASLGQFSRCYSALELICRLDPNSAEAKDARKILGIEKQ